MPILENRRIVLAVTGGIAAYKSCELVRLLKKNGADVSVVMTAEAARFVTPLTFEALSGHPAAVSEWDGRGAAMPHITATEGASLLLVAPATANIIAKAALGIADDLVSTLFAARRCPAAFAPAMNERMWRNPPNLRNIEQLAEDGSLVWGPASGGLACGDTGPGRMLEPGEILERVIGFFSEKFLRGRRVLVTAGPTAEPIDPVRILTNRSSGRQGFEIAREAARAGAAVTLVAGPCALETPAGVTRIDVETAQEMRDAVIGHLPGTELFVSVAAVSDWRPASAAAEKLRKTDAAPEIRLVENPDILAEVGALSPEFRPYTIGFAAETGELEKRARRKLEVKKADAIVGNRFDLAAGSERNTILYVTREGTESFGPAGKDEVARFILRRAAGSLGR